MDNNKICIIGLGYIGLPSAAILANHGYNVLGVDIKQSVIDTINKGEIHIVERGLEKFVNHAVNAKTLAASLKPQESDIFIIAVPLLSKIITSQILNTLKMQLIILHLI